MAIEIPTRADSELASGSRDQGLLQRYRRVRAQSESLAEPLAAEDCVIQSMPDVSPTKWHLAHTSWFFETFVLSRAAEYQPFDPQFGYLFNSYYVTVGERHCRPKRGLLSRPTVAEIYTYRRYVDDHMLMLLKAGAPEELLPIVELGLHHEQQHQELMLTDIKHVFATNPLRPVYREPRPKQPTVAVPLKWIGFPEGMYRIGHSGPGFAFDNECPRHRVFIETFELGSRLVTNGEFRDFIDDGGYRRPDLWLSDGWNTLLAEAWHAPLYWEKDGDDWRIMTLAGMQPLNLAEPVCHVNYYEADAFARWAGARLPTEEEWEVASEGVDTDGNLLESGRYQPAPLERESTGLAQVFGDVWEWTRSAYLPYRGFVPAAGALGEYNGKFMCNQFVLRGGSCATPASHIRRTYRNFFPPAARWQFTGLRLARDA